MIAYQELTYLSPPRPEKAIPRAMLPLYDKMGWLGQVKKNGTYSVIFVSPDKELSTKNRHGEEHKAWKWSAGSRRVFENLPGNGWYVICAELMHSKVAGIRDIHYLHDVLVNNGEYLLGSTYAQRYKLLQDLFLKNDASPTRSHWIVDEHTWLARNIRGGFGKIFDELRDEGRPEDEGLVLKDPRGILAPAKNGQWQVKCRLPHKNYSF